MSEPEIIFDRQLDPGQQHCNAQCDCACAQHSTMTGRPILGLASALEGSFRRADDLVSVPVLDDYRIVLSPRSAAGRAVLNRGAMEFLDAFSAPAALGSVCPRFPNTAPEDLLRLASSLIWLSLLEPSVQSGLNSSPGIRTLVAWLHTTNACNLRCSYCYVGKTLETMTAETGCRSIDTVVRSARLHGFGRIKLKFAGGEPTLHSALVRSLHRYAVVQASAYGLSLSSVVLSNGVSITDSFIDFLLEEAVDLMVSLDGIAEYHDRQRLSADGRGSFDAVAASIDRLLGRGVRPTISVTITDESATGLCEIIAYLLERNLPFNLNLCREHNRCTSLVPLRTKLQQVIEALCSAYAVIEQNLPRELLLGALLDLTDLSAPHDRTCGVGESYLVIDPTGRVAKCQMQMDRSITSVYAEDPLQAVIEDKTGVCNLPVQDKEGCRDCCWRHWCGGGCPLLTCWTTGRYDVQSPYCQAYTTLLPAVARLEGLRLLRYHREGPLI